MTNGEDTLANNSGEAQRIEEEEGYQRKKKMMKGNIIYWLTGRTPRESLPVNKQRYQQFFRLVTNNVSVWYEQHSTKNPNGVVPDPNITSVIKGNKFQKDK